MLANVFYAMTSPFPEIRNSLKLGRRRRQREQVKRRRQQLQGTTDNADDDANDADMDTAPKTPVMVRFWKPLAGLAYLCFGILAYDVLFERGQHWSVVDAVYFAVTCFTTVGYGDLGPTTAAGKFFTCFYGFAGIALLGAVVASIGSKLVHLELEAVKKVRKESQQQVLNLLHLARNGTTTNNITMVSNNVTRLLLQMDTNITEAATTTTTAAATNKDPDDAAALSFRRRLKGAWQASRFVANPLAVILSAGYVMGRVEQWNVMNSFYYALVTGSTIGLGDFSPQSRTGRMLAIVLIPVLVAATGEILAGVGIALLKQRQKRMFEDQVTEGLTEDHVKAMDVNDDGKVSREEYTIYMLLQMGIITRDELDDLSQQFDRLDVTHSGYIDSEDLLLMDQIRKKSAMLIAKGSP